MCQEQLGYLDHNITLPSESVPGWVSELAPINTVVAVLNVDDTDSGDNGNVTCEVRDSYFGLQLLDNSNNYKLTVVRQLNRETIEQHAVTVTCRDQGSPSLSASASLLVNVFDENDNNPVFTESEYSQVSSLQQKLSEM